MNDLVSRLRKGASTQDVLDAIDEIERLRRENERLMNANRILQQRDDYVTSCLV